MISEKYVALLHPGIQQFIEDHLDEDERELVLKHAEVLGIPVAWVAEQIIGKRKAKEKLPYFYSYAAILYPPRLALEQCSSESTAAFKASLLKTVLGTTHGKLKGADVTGGMGVDAFFLNQICDSFDYVEPDTSLLELARHNLMTLGASQIRYHDTTAEVFLKSESRDLDFIFIDPSRRKNGQKVFRLSDCDPVVTDFMPLILSQARVLLVKASPWIDLQQGIMELKSVEKITVVSVDNECKEVLFLCRKDTFPEPEIHCVNMSAKGIQEDNFIFTFPEEKKTTSVFSDPLLYLYEPNSSILKSGGFKLVGEKTGTSKLHPHTHLYTSEALIENFPGRIFKVLERRPDLKNLSSYFPHGKANVITRNYPLRVEQLKKKLKIADGGDRYLIGFSGMKEKFLVVAERIK